jgi:hypothetical protein
MASNYPPGVTGCEPQITGDYDRVPTGCKCPDCGEDDVDLLEWVDEECVCCASCGSVYAPADRGDNPPAR